MKQHDNVTLQIRQCKKCAIVKFLPVRHPPREETTLSSHTETDGVDGVCVCVQSHLKRLQHMFAHFSQVVQSITQRFRCWNSICTTLIREIMNTALQFSSLNIKNMLKLTCGIQSYPGLSSARFNITRVILNQENFCPLQ